VRPVWNKSKRSQSLPALDELIEEARSQRAGPPRDPWAVAYPHAVAVARDMLWREIKNDRRREAVLEEFTERISRIEHCLEGCDTLGDQLLALDQVLGHADFRGLDLRSRRDRKGPDDEALLAQYKEFHQRMRALFGQKSDRVYDRLEERLAIEFPHLSPEQVADAVIETPSWAACIAVGALHDLSPARVRDRIGAAGKQG